MYFGVETRTRIKVKRYESGVLPYRTFQSEVQLKKVTLPGMRSICSQVVEGIGLIEKSR